MTCPGCGSDGPDSARFCPACGLGLSTTDAVTIGTTGVSPHAPSGPIGVVSRRTPTPAAAVPKSATGWLSSSDSISHGRFAPGALLEGRYRIIEMLGKGGMGEVYRADDLRLGQPVALKFLPEGLRSDAVRLAQFHKEVRTAREVSHPNVCRVHDIGEADGVLYLSMEYVDGEDLASSLRRIGRFPEDKAADIARQLCAGLSAAHQRGVIHRDLKPANIMLDGAGRVRIMDFGLATVGPVEDVRAGTPAYMAPEQLLGKEVTHRSDIFALGLVMYERQSRAVLAFTAFFTVLNALGNVDPWPGALLGFLHFGSLAVVILRWGLLPFTIGMFVPSLLFDLPATFDTSAWFFGNMLFLLAILVGLAAWGFYTSLRGQLSVEASG